MSKAYAKRLSVLLSFVERGKGQKLMSRLQEMDIRVHFQCVGFGTAPTEMMDIFGVGSNDKEIIISLAAETAVKQMMVDFGDNFNTYSEYGGLMMVLRLSAANRLICEILHHNVSESETQGEEGAMKNEHKHNLILITVGEGYTDQVMHTAKRAGATGGTVLRARLAETEKLCELAQIDIEEEREVICILAPANVSEKIMEDVNNEFGLHSEAHGILCAVPVEKAYKI